MQVTHRIDIYRIMYYITYIYIHQVHINNIHHCSIYMHTPSSLHWQLSHICIYISAGWLDCYAATLFKVIIIYFPITCCLSDPPVCAPSAWRSNNYSLQPLSLHDCQTSVKWLLSPDNWTQVTVPTLTKYENYDDKRTYLATEVQNLKQFA